MGQNANFLYNARMNGNLYFKILVQSENTCVIRSKNHLEALRKHNTQYSKIRKKTVQFLKN